MAGQTRRAERKIRTRSPAEPQKLARAGSSTRKHTLSLEIRSCNRRYGRVCGMMSRGGTRMIRRQMPALGHWPRRHRDHPAPPRSQPPAAPMRKMTTKVPGTNQHGASTSVMRAFRAITPRPEVGHHRLARSESVARCPSSFRRREGQQVPETEGLKVTALDRCGGPGNCPGQSLSFFAFLSSFSFLRLVKRALPSPVPIVSTPQRSKSCMKGTSLSPWTTPSLCMSTAVS